MNWGFVTRKIFGFPNKRQSSQGEVINSYGNTINYLKEECTHFATHISNFTHKIH